MGLLMLRSRNLSSPMSPHKAEERKAEVEAEVVKEKEDSREAITQGRIILIEDNPIEVAGNLEVEEEEVVMTEAQTREPRVASRTPNQDRCYNCNEPGHFSRECPQRNNGNNNNRPQQHKTFPGFNVIQPQMYAQMPFPQMAQVPVQMAVPSAQVQMQNNSMTDQTAAMGHMREVMMQMQDVTADDNPCYMHMSEIPRKGEASLNF